MNNIRKKHCLEQIESFDNSIDSCTSEKRKLYLMLEEAVGSLLEDAKTIEDYQTVIEHYQQLIQEYKTELEFETENAKMCLRAIKVQLQDE